MAWVMTDAHRKGVWLALLEAKPRHLPRWHGKKVEDTGDLGEQCLIVILTVPRWKVNCWECRMGSIVLIQRLLILERRRA